MCVWLCSTEHWYECMAERGQTCLWDSWRTVVVSEGVPNSLIGLSCGSVLRRRSFYGNLKGYHDNRNAPDRCRKKWRKRAIFCLGDGPHIWAYYDKRVVPVKKEADHKQPETFPYCFYRKYFWKSLWAKRKRHFCSSLEIGSKCCIGVNGQVDGTGLTPRLIAQILPASASWNTLWERWWINLQL